MMFPEFDAEPMTAVARLKAVTAETSRIKAAREAMAFENLLATLDYVQPRTLAQVSRLVTSAIEGAGRITTLAPQIARRVQLLGMGINFVATNVPGAPVPIYLA